VEHKGEPPESLRRNAVAIRVIEQARVVALARCAGASQRAVGERADHEARHRQTEEHRRTQGADRGRTRYERAATDVDRLREARIGREPTRVALSPVNVKRAQPFWNSGRMLITVVLREPSTPELVPVGM